jgi:putative membrane protein
MRGVRPPLVAWVVLSLLPAPALAHAQGTVSPGEDALLLVLLGLPALLYAVGALRLRKRRSTNAVTTGRALAWIAGWLALLGCLVSPLDSAGARSFAAHMAQHEGLMLIAAPLLVASRPLAVFLWALPARSRRRIATWVRRGPVRLAWRAFTGAAAGWTLHAAALWIWHVPSIFQAALQHRGLHDLQHATFLITALLFWSGMFSVRATNRGVAAVYLFTTTVHTSALGALITFASAPWYEPPLRAASALDPLTDQQLGGLLMWVPGSFVYVAIGLLLLGRWIRDAGRLAHA